MPYSARTLADELFDYAKEVLRVVDQYSCDAAMAYELRSIVGRMKKTSNQARL